MRWLLASDLIPSLGLTSVIGDNRDNSRDSRYLGFVRSDLVIGKVIKLFR